MPDREIMVDDEYEFDDEEPCSGTLTIELEDVTNADAVLEYVTSLIRQGYTSGYCPTWDLTKDE
jgi:hypothetical protein